MRIIMKKCFLLFLLIGMVSGISETVHAEEDRIIVEINEETFPDDVFREHILTGYHYVWDDEGNQIKVIYDANQDGKLSESEIANIQQMLLQKMLIYDLTGIEYFTSLIELDCQMTQISALDVSKNTELQLLNCYETNLAGTLDLSANTKIERVSCSRNIFLENINVNNCVELNYLDFTNTEVASIDLSDNNKLVSLSCSDTPITELNLSNNPELEIISCYNTEITQLDVSNNPMLWRLDCSVNALESIDLSKNMNLINVNLSYTKIQGIDFSNHENLNNLMVTGNSFVWLNIGDDMNGIIYTDEGMAELTVPENGFDITEYFSGINTEKITIVSGGKLEGNIISGYEEGTPVVYTYSCGTLNNEEFMLTVTLNLSVKKDETSTTPGSDKDETSTVPDGDKDETSTVPDADNDESSNASAENNEESRVEDSKNDAKETFGNNNQEEKEPIPVTGDNVDTIVLLLGFLISAVIIVGISQKCMKDKGVS